MMMMVMNIRCLNESENFAYGYLKVRLSLSLLFLCSSFDISTHWHRGFHNPAGG